MSLLVVVVILGAALLIMSMGTFLIGFGAREGSSAMRESGEVLALADGCMNEVLLRLHRDMNYGVGSGVIPFTAPNGSCTLEVSDSGGDVRQIDIQASMNGFVRHIRSTVSIIGGSVSTLSWEERND